VAADAPLLKHIKTETVTETDFQAVFKTAGTVRAVPSRYAEVAPPFAGRVLKSYVQLGQRVAAGAPVFELGSSDFYEATKAFFAAQSNAELAKVHLKRQTELAERGVAAQRDLEQARNEEHIAAKEYEQARASLQLFNIDADALQMGEPLKVTSPIAGEVVRCAITTGSYIKEDAEPLVVVADLSRVWVAALVKENSFGSIRQGASVEVFTNAEPDVSIKGTIHYIGEMLNEETRSLEVIVECDNADRRLKLGMFCDVHFLAVPEKAIIVPQTAVMQEQESDCVLVEKSPGRFERRKVKTASAGVNTRIISGLSAGEKIVTEGGIYLN
jgi:cobalt-zinc-cadmium efflux system membrane fusion protein